MTIFKVDNMNDMNCLQNHPEDEVVYVSDEKKFFKWNGNEYEEYEVSSNSGIEIGLYELNQQLVSQQTPLTKEALNGTRSLLNSFKNSTDNKHYMFLCKELSSYTIFETGCKCKEMAVHDFASEVIELIAEYGKVFSVAKTEDGTAIEIWIQPEEDETAHAFYLFPYDLGVVYYG